MDAFECFVEEGFPLEVDLFAKTAPTKKLDTSNSLDVGDPVDKLTIE